MTRISRSLITLILVSVLFATMQAQIDYGPTASITEKQYSVNDESRQVPTLYDFSTSAQDPQAATTTTRFGVSIGYAPSPETFDVGIIVFFDDIGVTANYIFDNDVDWGGRVGIGKQISDKYTVFVSSIITSTNDDLNWGYGLDVGYNLTDQLSLSIGVESERKFRVGTYWTF